MSLGTYRFECGCEFPVIGPPPREGALPLLDVDGDHLPDNCPAVWDLLGKGLTKGVFQLESSLGRTWSKELKPESMEHLAALGSILRPGCLKARDDKGVSMTKHYCLRKNGEESAEAYHPSLEPILRPSYSIPVFQEQLMRIGQELAGFDLVEVDKLRKCVTGDTMFVSRRRGWVTIDRLIAEGYDDDLFYIMDGKGRWQWRRLEKIWSTGKHDVNEVLGSGGLSVWATKNHQFLTAEGWKARQRLTANDHLVAVRKVDFVGEDIVGRDLAVLIASLATEGHFVEGRRATFVAHEPSMMNVFVEAFTRQFGFAPSMDADGKVAYMRKAQKEIVARYLAYGKSGTKRLPDIMLGSTKETMRDVLSFMLAAEGGVSKSGQFEFSSKSFAMMKQVQLMLLRFGVRSYWLPKEIKGYGTYYRLYVNDVTDQRVMLRELVGMWPKTKVDSLLEIIGRKESQYTTDTIPPCLVRRMLDQYPGAANGESGSIFKRPISRLRFARVSFRTGDSDWEQLAIGRAVFQQVKSLENSRRQVETFDFTVEGGDAPYIVANGLVIHNSVGKKDQQELAKVKSMFLEGCEKRAIVTEEQAATIWGLMEKSGRYIFNKSHAMSYGLLGYDTAYIKAHFPVSFFANWLYFAKDKADPQLEMYELVEDAKLFDVPVEVPDVRGLNAHFSTDGVSVRFGLSDIKGVGVSMVRKLTERVRSVEASLNRPISEWAWEDFLFRVSDSVPSGGVKAMIAAGAFQFTGKARLRLANEYAAWSRLTDKEQEWAVGLWDVACGRGKAVAWVGELPRPNPEDFAAAHPELSPRRQATAFGKLLAKHEEHQQLVAAVWRSKPYSGLAELLRAVARPKPEGGGCSTEKRRQAVLSEAHCLDNPPASEVDTPGQLAFDEQKFLGVALSCSKVDACDVSQVNCTCKEFLAGRQGYLVLGVSLEDVREIRTKTGKNPGRKMGFLTVSDGTCTVADVTVFPDEWEVFRHILKKGNTVLLTGEKDEKRGGLIVKSAHQL